MSRSMRAVLALLAVLLELTCVSPDRARARATLSHDPERCTAGKTSTTVLTTTFAIDGGPPAPVTATASLPWQCAGKDPRAPTELRRK